MFCHACNTQSTKKLRQSSLAADTNLFMAACRYERALSWPQIDAANNDWNTTRNIAYNAEHLRSALNLALIMCQECRPSESSSSTPSAPQHQQHPHRHQQHQQQQQKQQQQQQQQQHLSDCSAFASYYCRHCRMFICTSCAFSAPHSSHTPNPVEEIIT